MNFQELKSAIRKSPIVFVWVMLSDNQGAYIKAEKKNFLQAIKNIGEDNFNAVVRECGNLYVN